MSRKAEVTSQPQQKRILVIGAGTGLTTAYMLENMPQFNVTLVESNNRLGGHIHTLYFYNRRDAAGQLHRAKGTIEAFEKDLAEGHVVSEKNGHEVTIKCRDGRYRTTRVFAVVEGGTEFVGPKAAYPNVHKLFEKLNVKLKEFELNADFHRIDPQDPSKDHHMLLPPLYDKYPKRHGFFCTDADTLELQPTDLKYLAAIQVAITEAKLQIAPGDCRSVLTLEQFVQRLKTKPLPQLMGLDVYRFANERLYRLLGAAWGVVIEEIKKFCAHYAMNYLSLGKQWNDAPNGLSTYIAELARQCEHLDVRLNTTVQKLIPVAVEAGKEPVYRVLLNTGEFLKNSDGSIAEFDEVVNTTPAYVMKDMLPDNLVDQKQFEADLADLKQKLSAVRYYDTTVVFHLDEKYKTDRNTVVHTRIETINGKEYAANTACKEKLGKGPVMKTWVLPGQPMPDPNKTLDVCHYKHPYQGIEYFIAQQKIHDMQNKFGLHFGGILAKLGDSHEDAITVALENAQRICSKYPCLNLNERLCSHLGSDGKVLEENSQLSKQTKEEVAEVSCCSCVVQ
jgi:predicted NAD/FAD-binding protein